MAYTNDNNFPIMPATATDFAALVNDLVNKLELGRTLKLTASGSTLTKGKPFYLNSSGQAVLADPSAGAIKCHGVWQSTSTPSGSVGYGQIDGTMTISGATFTPGDDVYASAGGTISQVSTILKIGYAKSATVIVLRPPN